MLLFNSILVAVCVELAVSTVVPNRAPFLIAEWKFSRIRHSEWEMEVALPFAQTQKNLKTQAQYAYKTAGREEVAYFELRGSEAPGFAFGSPASRRRRRNLVFQ